MSYRRAQNLKDRLVTTLVPSTSKARQLTLGRLRHGSFPCLNCINCAYMHKGEVFKHPGTGEDYKLRHHMTCTTDWVVYAMWCPCGLLYIGETKNQFKTRFNQHRYTIRKQRTDLPVSKHFLDLGHTEKQLKFMLLEHVAPLTRGGDRLTVLKKRELWWIFHLNTLRPAGLNIEFKVTHAMMQR